MGAFRSGRQRGNEGSGACASPATSHTGHAATAATPAPHRPQAGLRLCSLQALLTPLWARLFIVPAFAPQAGEGLSAGGC